MLVQEAVQHGAAAAEGHAEKFNAGETIIHHVANSPISEPLIHLPTIAGIDFSVTKHVLMLWLVAVVVFVVVTWAVRRYLRQDRLIPSGFMNALEAVVEFIRDDITQPNVGKKWVNTWTPLILTFFLFILCANAAGLVPIFDVIGLIDYYVLHTAEHSFIKQLLHGGTTATANFNVTAALATITFGAIIVAAAGVYSVRWLWQITNATALYPALLWIIRRTWNHQPRRVAAARKEYRDQRGGQ